MDMKDQGVVEVLDQDQDSLHINLIFQMLKIYSGTFINKILLTMISFKVFLVKKINQKVPLQDLVVKDLEDHLEKIHFFLTTLVAKDSEVDYSGAILCLIMMIFSNLLFKEKAIFLHSNLLLSEQITTITI